MTLTNATNGRTTVKESVMQIQAKTSANPTPVAVDYDLPEGLEAKRTKYGDEIVDAAAEDTIIISIQALMRRLINKGAPQADIQKAVSEWNPSIRTIVRQSAFEKASSSLDKLSPEERKQLLAKLQALSK
jgi:hypothetical protein